MESALRDLEHDKPEPPRVPKLMREDATPEGLAKKLQKEWPSAGVVSNEAGIVFGAHGMGKESVMRNLACSISYGMAGAINLTGVTKNESATFEGRG